MILRGEGDVHFLRVAVMGNRCEVLYCSLYNVALSFSI